MVFKLGKGYLGEEESTMSVVMEDCFGNRYSKHLGRLASLSAFAAFGEE